MCFFHEAGVQTQKSVRKKPNKFRLKSLGRIGWERTICLGRSWRKWGFLCGLSCLAYREKANSSAQWCGRNNRPKMRHSTLTHAVIPWGRKNHDLGFWWRVKTSQPNKTELLKTNGKNERQSPDLSDQSMVNQNIKGDQRTSKKNTTSEASGKKDNIHRTGGEKKRHHQK